MRSVPRRRLRSGRLVREGGGESFLASLVSGLTLSFLLLRWWGGPSSVSAKSIGIFVIAWITYGVCLSTWVWFVMPWVRAIIDLPRRKTRQSRAAKGLCRRCGYDLRTGHERCPECGERTIHI
jgi:hypothetical protein